MRKGAFQVREPYIDVTEMQRLVLNRPWHPHLWPMLLIRLPKPFPTNIPFAVSPYRYWEATYSLSRLFCTHRWSMRSKQNSAEEEFLQLFTLDTHTWHRPFPASHPLFLPWTWTWHLDQQQHLSTMNQSANIRTSCLSRAIALTHHSNNS